VVAISQIGITIVAGVASVGSGWESVFDGRDIYSRHKTMAIANTSNNTAIGQTSINLSDSVGISFGISRPLSQGVVAISQIGITTITIVLASVGSCRDNSTNGRNSMSDFSNWTVANSTNTRHKTMAVVNTSNNTTIGQTSVNLCESVGISFGISRPLSNGVVAISQIGITKVASVTSVAKVGLWREFVGSDGRDFYTSGSEDAGVVSITSSDSIGLWKTSSNLGNCVGIGFRVSRPFANMTVVGESSVGYGRKIGDDARVVKTILRSSICPWCASKDLSNSVGVGFSYSCSHQAS